VSEPSPDGPDVETPREQALFTAERAKTFVDAVVAIAMTLLILPLLESVSDSRGDTAAEWVADHQGQIFAFVISFAVVASFWIGHHRLFARVERVNHALLWLLVLWMATIVWLPVPTSMSGQLTPSPLLYVLYIGSMILTGIAGLLIRVVLRASPTLHDIPRRAITRGLIADVVLIVLFAVALAIAILVPRVNYYALFVLMLTGPVQAIIVKARHLGGDVEPATHR
jgi:uncharacterized membrane protein